MSRLALQAEPIHSADERVQAAGEKTNCAPASALIRDTALSWLLLNQPLFSVAEGDFPAITSQEANTIRQVIGDSGPCTHMLHRDLNSQMPSPFVIRSTPRHRLSQESLLEVVDELRAMSRKTGNYAHP